MVVEKEFYLICGPPVFTCVARWEEHLAWLREHPNMVGYRDHVHRAEEHIAWLRELGDPYPDDRTARQTRQRSEAVPKPGLEVLERELDTQQQACRDHED